jgi:hypothetical protein
MAVATYVRDDSGPSRRIVFGWWRSEQEACAAEMQDADAGGESS